MEPPFVKDRLRLLLDHFAEIPDPREPAKVRYPLREALFLVTCATVAGCDDDDEIAAWGDHHLDFLKNATQSSFFGLPGDDWLPVALNLIDPALFEACFSTWALSLQVDLIALDGKSLRRSGDTAAAAKPLHLVSARASTQRLVLVQEEVDAKANECAAIVAILQRLSLKGALVTTNAIATNQKVVQAILDAGGDYVLALTRNQPDLHDDVARYFADPAARGIETVEATEKDHGRVGTRRTAVCHQTGWLGGE